MDTVSGRPKRRILFRIDHVSNWPLQATRNEWARFLGVHYHTLRNAYIRGVLEGDYLDNKYYHTKRQILAWKAPTLLKEMDQLRREKNSQN